MAFQEFWPRYLAAHSDPRTRACHAAGTIAWLRAPFRSLAADYLMAFHVLRGTIDRQIADSGR